jgi:hypothetical protein
MFSLLILFFCLRPSLSATIAQYNFGNNFGTVFYDYSSNSNTAVNGMTTTTPTDRGAYFSWSCTDNIVVPPNTQKTSAIVLGSAFSIAMWVNLNTPSRRLLSPSAFENSSQSDVFERKLDDPKCKKDTDYYLTYRGSASGNFLYLKRSMPNDFTCMRLKVGSTDSTELCSNSKLNDGD